MALKIEKAAVLGSGVMGSAIAAHLANAGIPSLMLDIVPSQLTAGEKKRGWTLETRAVRNRLGESALASCLKAKPAPFFTKDLARFIEVGNFEDDWTRIKEADWIIEVVKEDLEIKRKVLAKVADHRKKGAIVTTNTSGLSVAGMVEGLDDDFRRSFFGTHFFNPPRYLHLVEIVPTVDSDPELVAALSDFIDRRLGKGLVIARDTPNFIANRVGVFGMIDTIMATQELGLTVEEIDFLTGPLVGRPKSASYRTADLVGLDTFAAVAQNVYDGCPDDEAREMFRLPDLIRRMLDKGILGQKSGGGFYKRIRGEGGKKEILTLDLEKLEYRPQQKAKFSDVEAVRTLGDLIERMAALSFGKGRAAQFTWRTLSRFLIYCANRVGEICDTVMPIDQGMRWGFGWEQGPFEIWDGIGFEKVLSRIQQDGLELPEWIAVMKEKGAEGFYRVRDGAPYIWDPAASDYRPVAADPGCLELTYFKGGEREVERNAGASLIDLGDGVACLEFHSKMNTLGGDIVSMIFKALGRVEKEFDGLVIGNQGANFSVGANIMMVLMEAQEQNWEEIDLMIRQFQKATMALKFAAKPVVVAPFGMTLGGGAEVTLHGQRVRAGAETYIGLVEVGAGLIPAGGGCKELYLRNLERWTSTNNLLPPLQATFETIGMAKVATSAEEAREMAFLRPSDRITMNPRRLISDAKETILSMIREGWLPPVPRSDIPVMGRAGKAAIEIGLFNFAEGRFISEHDYKIGRKLAHILSGGNLTGTQKVSEQYLLDLERESFLSLLGERKTLERIQHILKTGKPLRN